MAESTGFLQYEYMAHSVMFLALMSAICAIGCLVFFERARRYKRDNFVQAMLVRKIVHDVRDPLNGVLGYSEMLSSGYYGDVAPSQQGILYDIINCSKKISGFVKECSSFLLNKSGTLSFEWRRISMKRLIQSVIDEYTPRFLSNKISVHLTCKSEGYFQADSEKIHTAVASIFEYMCIKSKRGNDISVIVEETKRAVHCVFIFWPTESYSNRVDNLAVSLCKIIVEMHKGDLAIKLSDDGYVHIQLTVPKKKSV